MKNRKCKRAGIAFFRGICYTFYHIHIKEILEFEQEERVMKQVAVFLADGFEEIEGLTVTDLLRRAGVEVKNVSVTGEKMVQGAHGIRVEADVLFEDMDFSQTDMLVLPGGMPGTLHLKKHTELCVLLKEFYAKERDLAAICAAPTVFGELGFLEGRKACCYPGMEDGLGKAEANEEQVNVDGHIITSRGLGTAIPFALKLIERLCGKEKAKEIGHGVVYS